MYENEILVSGQWEEGTKEKALNTLKEKGVVLLEIKDSLLTPSSSLPREISLQLVQNYNRETDTVQLDVKELGVTRKPKLGNGKTNVHFEPYGSRIHQALSTLSMENHVHELVTTYLGKDCILSETGLSITRPGGDGLEWHADGYEGECTVIMSLDDVEMDQGPLGLVCGSHLAYDRSEVEDFDDEIQKIVSTCPITWYPYRAGVPVIFDGRTLHSAKPNLSDKFRVIFWWIYCTKRH
eukprot:NODE_6494_length_879_cov_26.149471_g5899_i0.p1 GENE.NODE_6494_length_879_cov_26.149471_g5899_i0~~NODE_6494_length_879_cov_26.149471_g5899_i0.p1  ORF type:complete len:255 (+),score=49.09 NODE_6494_length_879_cov_26.149471_g5899_i0:52-765(+)